MNIHLEFDREEDGRWLAEAPDLPGVMVYGDSKEKAAMLAQALALRVIADKLENGELVPAIETPLFSVSFYEPVAVN